MAQIPGVHDQKDLAAYINKTMAVQRAPRALWLLNNFGYGTRKDDLVLNTTRHGEKPTDLSAELLKTEENPDATVVDLGCGPGNSTEVILQYLPARTVIGVDPSSDFLKEASKNLAPHVESGRLSLRLGTAEGLSDIVAPNSADLVYGMVVWQFIGNVRQALQEVQTVLKPGAKFVTFISSTHYEFELPESSDGPITYTGDIGKKFLADLQRGIQDNFGIRVYTDSRISHQFNNLDTVRATARAAGLSFVKYEEKDWPYEKEVLPVKMRSEPRRILMNDTRLRGLLESGKITIDELEARVVEPAVQRVVNSPEFMGYNGRFTERWAACVLQKPYSAK